ncbi:MAG TPA: kinase/pyrophosphorylase, partial [Burkholderiales bacterium]|nr:kinase/pyrophosphorylase [Burkholderiales bacterium]
MADPKRTAFFVSDRTGITAEMLGHSLLTQFDDVRFNEITLPFVDSVEKAHDVVKQINQQGVTDGVRPLVISTLARTEIAQIIGQSKALFLDCFEIFISPLERELGIRASHAIGRTHNVSDFVNYHHRIESVNYTLSHDDGI